MCGLCGELTFDGASASAAGGIGDERRTGAPRPGRLRSLVERPGGARPSPLEDHRSVRARAAADGRSGPRPVDRLQRLHLQLQSPADRARGQGLHVLLRRRHRGGAESLARLGPRRAQALQRHVRLRRGRARQRKADAGARPARHQAAVLFGRARQAHPLCLQPAGHSRRRRCRHSRSIRSRSITT